MHRKLLGLKVSFSMMSFGCPSMFKGKTNPSMAPPPMCGAWRENPWVSWDSGNLPSGNLSNSYWKWPFIVDFPIKTWWCSTVFCMFTRPGNLAGNSPLFCQILDFPVAIEIIPSHVDHWSSVIRHQWKRRLPLPVVKVGFQPKINDLLMIKNDIKTCQNPISTLVNTKIDGVFWMLISSKNDGF